MNITQAQGCAAQVKNKFTLLIFILLAVLISRKDYKRILLCGHLYLLVDY